MTTISPICLDFTNHATHAIYYESQEFKQLLANKWNRGASRTNYENPSTIMQMCIEPLHSDYECPDPIRSYKIKVRVISKVKGESASYNEPFEDEL